MEKIGESGSEVWLTDSPAQFLGQSLRVWGVECETFGREAAGLSLEMISVEVCSSLA